MEHVGVLVRELVEATGLQARTTDIERAAMALVKAYLTAGQEVDLPEHRARRVAIASFYLAANHVILPGGISYLMLNETLARLPGWAGSSDYGANGILRVVTRFARRICPVDHLPETIMRGGWEYSACSKCLTVLSGTEPTTKRGRRKAVPLPSITPDIRERWGNAALRHARALVRIHPAMQPAIPGAMVLVRRYIDQNVNTKDILGPLLVKVVKMAMLHEAKAMDIPVTSSDLAVPPAEFVAFLSSVGASIVQPSSTGDAAILNQALHILATYLGHDVDEATRERVARFQAAVRRKLMGFSPTTAAGIIAYIDLARHHTDAVAIKVAAIAGTGQSTMHNSIVRFLKKVGRPGDLNVSLADRVRAAFPP